MANKDSLQTPDGADLIPKTETPTTAEKFKSFTKNHMSLVRAGILASILILGGGSNAMAETNGDEYIQQEQGSTPQKPKREASRDEGYQRQSSGLVINNRISEGLNSSINANTGGDIEASTSFRSGGLGFEVKGGVNSNSNSPEGSVGVYYSSQQAEQSTREQEAKALEKTRNATQTIESRNKANAARLAEERQLTEACVRGSSMCDMLINDFASQFPKDKQKQITDGLMKLIQKAKDGK
jgi:hypothetical protein